MKGVISTGSKKSLLLQEKSLNNSEYTQTEEMASSARVGRALLWSAYLAQPCWTGRVVMLNKFREVEYLRETGGSKILIANTSDKLRQLLKVSGWLFYLRKRKTQCKGRPDTRIGFHVNVALMCLNHLLDQ